MPFIQWANNTSGRVMDLQYKGNEPEDSFMELLCVLNRKWTILVITAIGNHEGVRFNELKRELNGISPKTLSETIKELENIGVVESTRIMGPPLRIQYYLTKEGSSLRDSILPALKWLSDRSASCNSIAVRRAIGDQFQFFENNSE